MIAHVTVTTENMQETIDFYQWLLELPIASKISMGNGGEIVFFGKPEETKFEVIYQPDTKVKAADGVTIGFAVDSIKDKIDLLDSRNVPHSPVISPTPHASFCFFTDLNGVRIQLFEEHK
jgi:lactoylglutathione lyase